jgi:hypothetical protein
LIDSLSREVAVADRTRRLFAEPRRDALAVELVAAREPEHVLARRRRVLADRADVVGAARRAVNVHGGREARDRGVTQAGGPPARTGVCVCVRER